MPLHLLATEKNSRSTFKETKKGFMNLFAFDVEREGRGVHTRVGLPTSSSTVYDPVRAI